MKYPAVMSENETLYQLERGKSIARIGDGELKLMCGEDQMREPRNVKLAKELRDIALFGRKGLVVGIPTMDKYGPKYLNWIRHRDRFQTMLDPRLTYGSAFISRPDSAPWINSKVYAEHFEKMWAGKRVALVAEEGTAIHRLVQRKASYLELFICPHRETYSQIDKLEGYVRGYDPDIALLSCGPAATCLAARLVGATQALDVGSCGGFLLKLLAGADTAEDDDGRTKK